MISRAVGQEYPADLHRIRIGSGRSPLISRSTTSTGTDVSCGQGRDGIVVGA